MSQFNRTITYCAGQRQNFQAVSFFSYCLTVVGMLGCLAKASRALRECSLWLALALSLECTNHAATRRSTARCICQQSGQCLANRFQGSRCVRCPGWHGVHDRQTVFAAIGCLPSHCRYQEGCLAPRQYRIVMLLGRHVEKSHRHQARQSAAMR